MPGILLDIESGARIVLTRLRRPVAVMMSPDEYDRVNGDRAHHLDAYSIEHGRRRLRNIVAKVQWGGDVALERRGKLEAVVMSMPTYERLANEQRPACTETYRPDRVARSVAREERRELLLQPFRFAFTLLLWVAPVFFAAGAHMALRWGGWPAVAAACVTSVATFTSFAAAATPRGKRAYAITFGVFMAAPSCACVAGALWIAQQEGWSAMLAMGAALVAGGISWAITFIPGMMFWASAALIVIAVGSSDTPL